MNLLDLSRSELYDLMSKLNEEKYRAVQLMKWIYAGASFDEMSNISLSLIKKLRDLGWNEGILKEKEVLVSNDGTRKYLLTLDDGLDIECVLMVNNYGNTLCISSQVGCSMKCSFCASGKFGKQRDLTPGEMLGQFITVNRDLGKGRNIKNIVVMGMGEPFDNYDNLVAFLRSATSPECLGISARDISVSTCGLPDKIREFTGENIPVNLCLSLHASSDEKRMKVMPIAKKYHLSDILKAAELYYNSNHRRIIIEYILIKGFNDTEDDVRGLKKTLSGLNCHVNVIRLNDNGGTFNVPSKTETYAFVSKLEREGLSATVRMSHGSDILGACGQLRNKNYGEN